MVGGGGDGGGGEGASNACCTTATEGVVSTMTPRAVLKVVTLLVARVDAAWSATVSFATMIVASTVTLPGLMSSKTS